MIVLGVDLHKRSHTAVAVDEHGRKLAERTVEATDAGHLELRRWASQRAERRWALEDGRHLSRRLEADLLRAGEDVVRVPPKLMAGARRSGREPGKSDPIDALAVARAALREPDLPTARLEGEAREIRLLVDRREDLVAERTREAQRLRWYLLDLGLPEPPPASLDRATVRARLDRALAARAELVARLAREILARIGEAPRSGPSRWRSRGGSGPWLRRSCSSSAADRSPLPRSSARRRASVASGRGRPSPATPGRPRSRSGRGTRSAIG